MFSYVNAPSRTTRARLETLSPILDVRDARYEAAIVDLDPDHTRVRLDAQPAGRLGPADHVGVGGALRTSVAPVRRAESAVRARRVAVVDLRVHRRRGRKRVPAELARGCCCELGPARPPHRTHRVGAGAHSLEGVSLRIDGGADPGRGARDADCSLDGVVERLQLLVVERPVGQRRALRDRARPVALDHRATATEVPRLETDAQTRVVDSRAADRVHHQRRKRSRD